jgi:hypothetical protein
MDMKRLFRFLNRRILALLDLMLKPYRRYHEVEVSKEQLIKLLGQFKPLHCGVDLIRVGPEFDGGYLVPNDLEGISWCISPGCGAMWGFEKDLWERHRIPSIIVDHENKKPIDLPEEFVFENTFIGYTDQLGYSTLNSIIQKNCRSGQDLMLQMDIEGHEYLSILASDDDLLKQFRVIVIELHYLNRVQSDVYTENLLQPFINKLTKNHTVVHLHPNNLCGVWKLHDLEFPLVCEITLLRNDRIKSEPYYIDLPHKLDSPNVKNIKELNFNFANLPNVV